jgi:hypothetical protein
LYEGDRVTDTEAFDYVFDQTTSNNMLFAREVKPLVAGFVDGVSASVLAFGHTGCGKTMTVEGQPGQSNGVKYGTPSSDTSYPLTLLRPSALRQ